MFPVAITLSQATFPLKVIAEIVEALIVFDPVIAPYKFGADTLAALMVLAYPRTPPMKVVPVTVLAPAIVPYRVVPEMDKSSDSETLYTAETSFAPPLSVKTVVKSIVFKG
jgi:hypothetical protein